MSDFLQNTRVEKSKSMKGNECEFGYNFINTSRMEVINFEWEKGREKRWEKISLKKL
jgi:hypothetical protein